MCRVVLAGDYVAACDVSNSSCEEGHDNPWEERVFYFTDREWGKSVCQTFKLIVASEPTVVLIT